MILINNKVLYFLVNRNFNKKIRKIIKITHFFIKSRPYLGRKNNLSLLFPLRNTYFSVFSV